MPLSIVADINPIGGISKTDLKKFIAWAEGSFDLPILNRSGRLSRFSRLEIWLNALLTPFLPLRSFLDATPTAELEPITENYVQADEVGRSSLSVLC